MPPKPTIPSWRVTRGIQKTGRLRSPSAACQVFSPSHRVSGYEARAAVAALTMTCAFRRWNFQSGISRTGPDWSVQHCDAIRAPGCLSRIAERRGQAFPTDSAALPKRVGTKESTAASLPTRNRRFGAPAATMTFDAFSAQRCETASDHSRLHTASAHQNRRLPATDQTEFATKESAFIDPRCQTVHKVRSATDFVRAWAVRVL